MGIMLCSQYERCQNILWDNESADNLGRFGEFKESFSSFRVCMYCMATHATASANFFVVVGTISYVC